MSLSEEPVGTPPPGAGGGLSEAVVVTGGARGIGRAIALAFARRGRPVALCDLNGEAAERTAAQLRAEGVRALAAAVDVTDEVRFGQFFEAVEGELGPVGVLVNNAGIAKSAPTEELDPRDWRRIIDVNLTAVFLCAQVAARRMLPRGSGSIINLASMYGLRAVPTRTAYVASKFGVVGLTQAMAIEWAPRGVRVNALAPGYTDTELFRGTQAAAGTDVALLVRRTPLGRLGTVEDIANAAVFLASPEASFVVGHTLVVDGGWLPNGGW